MEVIQKLADEWDDEEDGMEETLNEGIPKLNQVRNCFLVFIKIRWIGTGSHP